MLYDSKIPSLRSREICCCTTCVKSSYEDSLKLRPGGRFGHYNPDNGDMGLGDGPTYDKAIVTVAHLKYAIQWTKLLEYSTDTSAKAVTSAYQDLLAGAMPEFRRALNASV
jgi:hypothetical protein